MTVSRDNLYAWVAAGLSSFGALKGRDIEGIEFDIVWGWKPDDTIDIAIVTNKRKEGRSRYRKLNGS